MYPGSNCDGDGEWKDLQGEKQCCQRVRAEAKTVVVAKADHRLGQPCHISNRSVLGRPEYLRFPASLTSTLCEPLAGLKIRYCVSTRAVVVQSFSQTSDR